MGKVIGCVGLAAEEDQAATTLRDQEGSARAIRVIGRLVQVAGEDQATTTPRPDLLAEARSEACAGHVAHDDVLPSCGGVQAGAGGWACGVIGLSAS